MYFEKLGIEIPESMTTAESKVMQLRHEVDSIREQLDQNTQPMGEQTPSSFAEWKANATKAMRIKARQIEALEAWLGRQKEKVNNSQPDILIYESFQVFKSLKERGVPLDVDEQQFLSVLEGYLRDRTGMVS